MSGAASFTCALFYHHPLLRSLRGQKLSKSAGDISVRHLRKEGLKPRQVYTRIAAMLGSKEDVKDWRTLAAIVLPPDLPPDLLKGLSGGRSEERRVGKECVSTCRSGWAP